MHPHHQKWKLSARPYAAGLRDACGAALASALNNYLELFTQVLFLWYGGALVMRGDGELSFGRLIAFQLYWRMMRNSFQALQDVLNTQTR